MLYTLPSIPLSSGTEPSGPLVPPITNQYQNAWTFLDEMTGSLPAGNQLFGNIDIPFNLYDQTHFPVYDGPLSGVLYSGPAVGVNNADISTDVLPGSLWDQWMNQYTPGRPLDT